MHADAAIYAGLFDGDEAASSRLEPRAPTCTWCAARRGQRASLEAGDALRIEDEPGVSFEHGHDAEVLLFDLP